MDPPYALFHYIDIRACWPASEDILRAYEHQVTPKGHIALRDIAGEALLQRARLVSPRFARETLTAPFDALMAPLVGDLCQGIPGTSLNALGLLQVCLLSTKPFQGCQDEHVWALHYTPREAFHCQNWPALIENLADALLEYECALQVYAQDANALQELAEQTVKNAETLAEAYARLLRRRPEAPTPGRQRPRVPRVTEALEVLRSMEQGFSSARHQQLEQAKNTWRSRLVARLYALFEQYGPGYKSYPDVAVSHALAAILLQLGVEEGDDLGIVAARLRIRRARRKKPPPSQP